MIHLFFFQDTFHVSIIDNPQLDSCNYEFLCDALARYPEEVRIQNNGPGCTREAVEAYCRGLSTGRLQAQEVSVYPNPVHEDLVLSGMAPDAVVTIVDMSGRQLYRNRIGDGTVDVSSLSDGMYVIKVNQGDECHIGRFMKH